MLSFVRRTGDHVPDVLRTYVPGGDDAHAFSFDHTRALKGTDAFAGNALAPAMYAIHYGEVGYSMLEERFFLGSWLTLRGAGVVALLVGLVGLIRRRIQPSTDPLARITLLLIIVLAGTVLVWRYALRFSLQSVAATSPYSLYFGLPAAYWWIFATAVFIGVLPFGLILTTVAVWWRKVWPVPGRIALTAATFAAVIFSGILAYWGIFTALLP